METTFSKKVRILPWVGNNYSKEKVKILVLGMSTYPEKHDRNVVNIIVKSLIDETWEDRHFWKKTYNLLKKDDEETQGEFWNRLSLYEYIQELLPPKAKPTKENWQNAQEPFAEILDKLKPDIIAVMGFSTFDHLNIAGENCPPIKYKKEKMEILRYKANKKVTYFCRLIHNSHFGYIKAVWRALFFKFLEKYK
jgi:hypothetical protein